MSLMLVRAIGLGTVLTLAGAAVAATGINTGFEPPDFAIGALNGQPNSAAAADQWLVSGGGSSAIANVSTANPASGTQALRLSPLGALAGTPSGAFSPIITIAADSPTVTRFDVSINGVTPGPVTGGSEYTILLADRAHGRKAVEMVLSFTGDILVDNGGATLVDTGADWTTGPYQTFEIDVNQTALTYKRNGAQFFTSGLIPAGLNGSDTVDEIQIVSDNFGDPTTETSDFDNVSLTVAPEPIGAALLGLVVVLTRRARIE
jgi:hypothetical protein